ncbi:MAG: hypothetical protein CL912_23620 [Deltaproteobacteria bacterium]|nr:hypothetical protein [Deltaproteobacteria bacterium]
MEKEGRIWWQYFYFLFLDFWLWEARGPVCFQAFHLKADFQLKMKNGLVVTPSITPFFDSPSLWD